MNKIIVNSQSDSGEEIMSEESPAYIMQKAYRDTKRKGDAVSICQIIRPLIFVEEWEIMWEAIDAYVDMEDLTCES